MPENRVISRMKICVRCQVETKLTKFSWTNDRECRRSNICCCCRSKILKERKRKQKIANAKTYWENPQKHKDRINAWRREYPEKQKILKDRQKQNLTDGFIVDRLRIRSKDVSKELIELKRHQLIVAGLSSELKKQVKKMKETS
jgi:hypothetical protein